MDTAKLIADLIAGKWGLEELAERHGITLEELARFAASGETLRRLAALRQLADAQTQLTLSKHRQFAVVKLYELAQGEGETARKACVDLLKLDVKNAPTAAAKPPEAEVIWELEPFPPDPNPWGHEDERHRNDYARPGDEKVRDAEPYGREAEVVRDDLDAKHALDARPMSGACERIAREPDVSDADDVRHRADAHSDSDRERSSSMHDEAMKFHATRPPPAA